MVKAKHAKTHCPPIGEVLAKIKTEKIPKNPVGVCLQPSLATYVRAHGGSTFVREKLVKVLKLEFEEAEERKAAKTWES